VKTFHSLDDIPPNFGPTAVTVGKFDGIHIGHRRMIDRLLDEANNELLVPSVLTFDRNPLSFLAPDSCPPALVSNTQKLELLEKLGVQATIMLTFDRALREVEPEVFVKSVLADALHARIVYVGPDFRFGLRGKGNVDLLEDMSRACGFEVRHFSIIESEGRRVSSTWVRELLAEGDVAGARALLGRPQAVRGRVVRGAQRGRELGFPTANLSQDSEGLIPADGVYAAWAFVDEVRYPAAVSIGNNPTFDGVAERQVEAYLLSPNFEPVNLELYDAELELLFVERLRGMAAFDGVDYLVAAMNADVGRAVEILRNDLRSSESTPLLDSAPLSDNPELGQ
jgi:riboflavin kinase / FMN adenylyltransferase